MVGAVLILGLVVCGVVAFVTLGSAAQDWARSVHDHAERHRG